MTPAEILSLIEAKAQEQRTKAHATKSWGYSHAADVLEALASEIIAASVNGAPKNGG